MCAQRTMSSKRATPAQECPHRWGPWQRILIGQERTCLDCKTVETDDWVEDATYLSAPVASAAVSCRRK